MSTGWRETRRWLGFGLVGWEGRLDRAGGIEGWGGSPGRREKPRRREAGGGCGCGSAGSAKEVRRRGVGDGPLRRAEIYWAGPLILSAFGESHGGDTCNPCFPPRPLPPPPQPVCSPPAPAPISRGPGSRSSTPPKAAPSGLQLRARWCGHCFGWSFDDAQSLLFRLITCVILVAGLLHLDIAEEGLCRRSSSFFYYIQERCLSIYLFEDTFIVTRLDPDGKKFWQR